MQKSAYYCDNCKKVIGDKIHISLNMNKGLSGLAIPPDFPKNGDEVLYSSNWRIISVPNGFMHFHIQCIEKYFINWGNKLTGNEKPKKK